MVELDAPKPKKKKRGKSPTALTLEECGKRGWIAQVVEQRIPHTFITRDLFGIIDIIAVVPGEAILGIQATSNNGGTHAARVHKALAEPRLTTWLKAGGRFAVWSWSKRGRLWVLREEDAILKRGAES